MKQSCFYDTDSRPETLTKAKHVSLPRLRVNYCTKSCIKWVPGDQDQDYGLEVVVGSVEAGVKGADQGSVL